MRNSGKQTIDDSNSNKHSDLTNENKTGHYGEKLLLIESHHHRDAEKNLL